MFGFDARLVKNRFKKTKNSNFEGGKKKRNGLTISHKATCKKFLSVVSSWCKCC